MIFSACSEERPPLPLLVAPLLAHGAIPPHPLCGSSAPRPSDIKLLQRKSQALEHSSTTRTCPRGSILTQFTCPQRPQQRPRAATAPCVLSVPCSHLGLRTQVPSNKMLGKIQLLSLVGFSRPHPVRTVPIPPPLGPLWLSTSLQAAHSRSLCSAPGRTPSRSEETLTSGISSSSSSEDTSSCVLCEDKRAEPAPLASPGHAPLPAAALPKQGFTNQRARVKAEPS